VLFQFTESNGDTFKNQSHLPEFGPDLITALACLNMNDLSHLGIMVLTMNPSTNGFDLSNSDGGERAMKANNQ
jgi:hypothetical protein